MSVAVRKLDADEVERFFPRRSSAPQADYVNALSGLKPGDAAEAERDGVTQRAFKRRLSLAAKHLGYTLKYAKQSEGESVRFIVRPARSNGETGAPRRRGRPPKNG